MLCKVVHFSDSTRYETGLSCAELRVGKETHRRTDAGLAGAASKAHTQRLSKVEHSVKVKRPSSPVHTTMHDHILYHIV